VYVSTSWKTKEEGENKKGLEKKEEEPLKMEIKESEKKEEEPPKEEVTEPEKKEESPKETVKKDDKSAIEAAPPKQEKEPEKKQKKPKVKEKKKPETIATTSDGEKTKKASKSLKKPLNILLLFGDDWRHDSVGSASNGLVKTPFLDNLATQGIRFTHNCVTTSVCWVSRATLYSGQYVSRHKSTEPMKPEFYKGWNKTFPFLLREKGDYLGHVGKWHFNDYFEFVKPQLDWERFYYGSHWYPDEKGGEIHTTKKNEQDAITFLRERP
jgi:hypothetical protein